MMAPMVERDVVEFGAEEPRSRLAGLWAGRSADLDRRLVLGGVGLGALLVFASLLQTWQTTVILEGPPSDSGPASAGISALRVLGTGYVVGILGLAPLAGCALLADGPVRRHARLAALCWGGTLIGLLIVLCVDLGRGSVWYPEAPPGALRQEVGYGPGPFLALAGVAAVLVALRYSARGEPAGPARDGQPERSGTAADGDDPSPPGRPVPSRVTAPPHLAVGPLDITVAPTAPFVHPEHGDR